MRTILMLLSGWMIGAGFAYAGPKDLSVNLGSSETISRDVPAGTELSKRKSGNENVKWMFQKSVRTTGEVSGTLVPGYSDVYQTNLSGVGVRFHGSPWHSSKGWRTMPFSVTSSRSGPAGIYVTALMRGAAQLVIVGPVEPGKLTSFPTASLRYVDVGSDKTLGDFRIKITGAPTIKARGCSVETPNIMVDMPTLSTSALREIGAGAGRRPFDIRLSCDAGVNVHTTLTDATAPGNRSTLLSLARGSSADGVAFRVLHDGKPVQFGPESAVAGTPGQFQVKKSEKGALTIPLEVEYVATGDVSPGAAEGNALFTMSYQ